MLESNIEVKVVSARIVIQDQPTQLDQQPVNTLVMPTLAQISFFLLSTFGKLVACV